MPDAPRRILALPCDDFACGQWRILQPFAALRDPRLACYFPPREGSIPLDAFDVAVFQRILLPRQLPQLQYFKSNGKKIVIDYDDAFPLADPALPDYPYHAAGTDNHRALLAALETADALLVSTPELVAHYKPLHPRVVLAPNCVNLDGKLYAPGPLARPPELLGKTVLFWSGWTSHANNLQLIAEPVIKVLSERDDAVLLLAGPPEFAAIFAAAGEGKVLSHPPVQYTDFMRLASLADITLAPLDLTPFNDAKSEIRLIEPAAWSVPAIASPAAPYRRFATCLLADNNSPDLWLAHLRNLLDNTPTRKSLGQQARETVATRYTLTSANTARAELLAGL
jgi:O-antigen biosynthesis protein